MNARTLNTVALLATAVAGTSWIAFHSVGTVSLLLVGGIAYLVGLTAFLAFATAVIMRYLREAAVRITPDDSTAGHV